MAQNTALEVSPEVALHEPGHPRLVELALALERQPGLEVLAHHRMQHRALGMARAASLSLHRHVHLHDVLSMIIDQGDRLAVLHDAVDR